MELETLYDSSTISVFNTTRSKDRPPDVYTNETVSEEGLVSLSITLLIVNTISCGIRPVVSLLGAVGNTLCLIVIFRQGFKQTTNIILFGLAVADLVYVLLSFRTLVLCVAQRLDAQLANNVDIVSKAVIGSLESEVETVSRLYTCFIAVERCVAVMFPLKASSLLTRGRTLAVSGFLWVAGLLSCLVCFFLFDISETYDPVQNNTVTVLDFSDLFRQHSEVIAIYTNLLRTVLFRFIPTLLIFVCSVFILRTLTRSRLQRQKMIQTESSANDQQQRQITTTLLAICIMSLMTNIPAALLDLLTTFYANAGFSYFGRYKNIHDIVLAVGWLSLLFNSSVNFMLYIIFNQKFAATARQIFSFCYKKRFLGTK